MKNLSIISIFIIISLVSCSKGDESSSRTVISKSPVFHASFENTNSKTYCDSNQKLLWTADDRLSIFMTTYNQQYKFMGNTGDNNGDFEEIPVSDFHSGTALSTNYAVYPYMVDTKISYEEVLTINMPAVQYYAEKSFGPGANTMVAVTENSNDTFLSFKNICGYLVLKIFGEGTISGITLKGNNGEKIAGSGKVSIRYGNDPAITMEDNATEEITISCGSGVKLGGTAEEATEFWFCVPPVNFSQGFTITITNSEGLSMVKTVSSSKSISRNVMNSMATFEISFNETGIVEFDDTNFKNYCVANFDTDGDKEISYTEAAKIEEIICEDQSICSAKGIEHFIKLKKLIINNNNLSYLDVSQNPNLAVLECYHNNLTSLDVSKNTALTHLSCSFNKLRSIDISKNIYLRELICGSNLFTELNISSNAALEKLYCENNQIANLDISINSCLKTLWCHMNQLSSLDVSNNTLLSDLECYDNQLIYLDVSKNIALEILRFDSNNLSDIDLSNNINLLTLQCGYNQLTSIDISKNTALTYVNCDMNQLVSLDVSANSVLQKLYCQYNQLSDINLENNTALTILQCDWNQLTNLEICNNINLKRLSCSGNRLTCLDVSNNLLLVYLYCPSNPNLAELWLKQGQNISTLIYDQTITTIKYL